MRDMPPGDLLAAVFLQLAILYGDLGFGRFAEDARARLRERRLTRDVVAKALTLLVPSPVLRGCYGVCLTLSIYALSGRFAYGVAFCFVRRLLDRSNSIAGQIKFFAMNRTLLAAKRDLRLPKAMEKRGVIANLLSTHSRACTHSHTSGFRHTRLHVANNPRVGCSNVATSCHVPR